MLDSCIRLISLHRSEQSVQEIVSHYDHGVNELKIHTRADKL